MAEKEEIKPVATSNADVKRDGEKKGSHERRKRRRRNYDDYDAEVNKEEQELKKHRKELISSGVTKIGAGDSDIDDEDIDDAKLDQLLATELNDDVEDDLAEIDTSNIITGGRRTRGKIIDYKKTAKELDADEVKGTETKNTKNTASNDDNDDDEDDEEDADFNE